MVTDVEHITAFRRFLPQGDSELSSLGPARRLPKGPVFLLSGTPLTTPVNMKIQRLNRITNIDDLATSVSAAVEITTAKSHNIVCSRNNNNNKTNSCRHVRLSIGCPIFRRGTVEAPCFSWSSDWSTSLSSCCPECGVQWEWRAASRNATVIPVDFGGFPSTFEVCPRKTSGSVPLCPARVDTAVLEKVNREQYESKQKLILMNNS